MEKKPMFYGGKVGPWIPVLLMLAGMLASTIIGGGGLNRLTGISFFAISVGFLLCKDKKQFGKITLKGLQNPMLGTILMAYLMAGMLAQLLRQSGLITALIWGISKLGMNAGWIPLIGFIACLLISTSCGTSTGSVAAVLTLQGAVSGRAVAVQMTGGELVVDVERRGSTVEHLFLTGPTNLVAKGELTDEELPL